MKKLLKTLFVMIVVGLVVAAVASYMSKKRLESMSDDEIREFLAAKLDGKVAEEQLATIQEAVISGIRGKTASSDSSSEIDEDDAAEDESVVETDDEPAEDVDDEGETEEVSAS